MTYTEFKEMMINRIPDELPEEYHGAQIVTERRYKVNRSLDSFIIKLDSAEKGVSATPFFYMNELYARYLNGESIRELITEIIEILNMDIPRSVKPLPKLDLESVKQSVCVQLINHKKNEELLKHVVHKDFLDLAVIYRIIIGSDEESTASVMITDEMLTAWGITEAELHDIAVKNTNRAYPFVLKHPKDLLTNEENSMYLLTNSALLNGASTMIFDDVLEQVGETIGDSFYIIPSSIHELFLLKYDPEIEERIKKTIRKANMTFVLPEEQLSDNLYLYDAEDKKVKIA